MFKSRKRINEIMYPIVAPMSEQDFADVAAYFAAQTPAGLEADPSYWKAGEALYTSGDSTRNIPACTACHGPAGQGNAGVGLPGAARAAFGLHREAVAGLPHARIVTVTPPMPRPSTRRATAP